MASSATSRKTVEIAFPDCGSRCAVAATRGWLADERSNPWRGIPPTPRSTQSRQTVQKTQKGVQLISVAGTLSLQLLATITILRSAKPATLIDVTISNMYCIPMWEDPAEHHIFSIEALLFLWTNLPAREECRFHRWALVLASPDRVIGRRIEERQGASSLVLKMIHNSI